MVDKTIHTLELGLIYEEQGYHGKAREHFAGALKNDPENQTLVKALERVAALGRETDNFSDLSRLSDLVEKWISLVFLQHRLSCLGFKGHRLQYAPFDAP